MLPILKPYFNKKGDPSAADCRAALEVVESELATVRGRLGELRAKRADALVNGVPCMLIDAIDTDLRRADIERERLKIAGERTAEDDRAGRRPGSARRNADAILKRAVEREVPRARSVQRVCQLTPPAWSRCSRSWRRPSTRSPPPTPLWPACGDPRSVAGDRAVVLARQRTGIVQFPPWSLLDPVRLPDPEVARRLLWPREAQA